MQHDFSDKKYDWVIGSGLFAIKMDGWIDFVMETLTKMLTMSNKGIVVNFLSSLRGGEFPENRMFVHPSFLIYRITEDLTTRFSIKHDYLINDFTLFLPKVKA